MYQLVALAALLIANGQPFFFDDLESGGGDWSAKGGWSLVTDTAHSPVAAWGSGVVTPGQPLTLTLLAPLDLSTARMVGLTFWHTYTLSNGGRAQVEFSSDGGATWQTLATLRGGARGWTPVVMSLTRLAGPGREPLRLRFQLLPGGPGDRWRIDDALVEELEHPSFFELPFEDDVESWQKWEGTGDWAVVTGTVHGGERSWGATQDGSTLTLVGRLDLRDAATPRLSFWHLFEGDAITGVVEVSPDETTWLTLTTVITTEGAWQRAETDLSDYAGQMIYLRFRLDAPNGGNWYLDDFAAWEAIPPLVHGLPFDDDMEEPEANWRAVNGWKPVTTTAHSDATAWWGSEDDSALILVDQLDLTGTVSPKLTFWQRFTLPEGSVGQVRVATDDEPAWQSVLTITEPISDWTQVEIDLSAYAGRQVRLAFVLEEVADGGGGSAWLEPDVLVEGAGRTQPAPAVPSAATALPLVVVALAGVVGATSNGRYRRWKKHILVGGAVLATVWVCLFLCGLWRYVPPLRYWTINHLDMVEGCEVEVIMSARRHPFGTYLSPNGRWMLVNYARDPDKRWTPSDWLLLDLVEGTEQKIGLGDSVVRWLEDDLFVGENIGGYYLMSVPELTKTPLSEYQITNSIDDVALLREAEQLYAIDKGGAYMYIALDKSIQSVYRISSHLTPSEHDALLEELPQAVVIPRWPYMTMVETQLGARTTEHRRYYSRDDSLYAEVAAGQKHYLQVITTEEDNVIAQVRKRGYAPVPLGWTADGRGFYFQMHTGAVAGVLTPESPVYLLRLPDTVPASTPASTGESRVPGIAQLLPVSHLPAPAAEEMAVGWYVDDVVVRDAKPYRIVRATVATSGGVISSTSFIIKGTVGQIDTFLRSSESYRIRGGIWNGERE